LTVQSRPLRTSSGLAKILFFGGVLLIASSTLTLGLDVVPALANGSDPSPNASSRTINWADGVTDADGNVTPRDVTDPNYSNFQNMQFTVSQTENLTHQGITVSWTNAHPSSGLQFAQDFMQLMQCWSDDPRTCQFGTPNSVIAGKSGFQVQSRVISPGLDPIQATDLHDDMISGYDPNSNPLYSFPFISFGTGDSTFDVHELFASTTTNEVSAAPTGADGSGMVNFEVQTSLEAHHLGCGTDDGFGVGKACYLVIVPRGELDLNGQPAADSSGRINGSPLSLAAWRNRVVIPLNFAPVSVSCPLGQHEVRVVGNDLVAKAFASWQPALCQTGATYGFSRIGDDEARRQVTSTGLGSSHVGLVSQGMSDTNPDAAGIDYAPVAQSALVIAFNIDYSLDSDSALYALKNGTKVHDLRLNQRLVAKLLTQSYREDNPGAGFGNETVQANPRALTVDPEFVALNPEFADFNRVYPQGLMVPFGNSDVYRHVWEWVISDPAARSFLEGTEDDGWGMKVNPTYQALGLTSGQAPPNFPKSELHTYSVDPDNIPAFGSLELRPYFGSLDEVASRILRADGNVKTAFDSQKLPPPGQYVAYPPQAIGERFSIGITDMASAQRYGLDVAALAGSVADNYVLPNRDTVGTAISSWPTSAATGVAVPSWSNPVADAYPLAEAVYASVSICYATDEERSTYRQLISWLTALDGGQVEGDAPGNMPRGYFAISDAQRTQVDKALADLGAPADKARRCAKPSKSSWNLSSRSSSLSSAPLSESSDTPSEGPKLFIRSPFYGDEATGSHDPVISRILLAGGYVAGIPLAITGYLMQRPNRRPLSPSRSRP